MDNSPISVERANAAGSASRRRLSHDSTQFKAHKALPRPRTDSQRPFSSGTSAKARLQSDDGSASLDGTPLGSPTFSNGKEPTLPPTPPANTTELARDSNSVSSAVSDGVFGSKTPSLSTPINQRSPPTPDPSPPRTTESYMHDSRPSLLQLSSRAESFRTAREDQWSSEDDGDRRSRFSSSGSATVKNSDPVKRTGRRNSLGLAFERDDSLTPTGPSPLRREARLEQENAGPSIDRNATIKARKPAEASKREWDTNMMRNVSVRRKMRSITPTDGPASTDNSTENTPSSRRNFSAPQRLERPTDSPVTPTMEQFARTVEWPHEVNNALNAHLRDSAKRMSGESTASTVVEAIVISTPPQRRRTLRHTSKNLDLRNTTVDSSSTHSRPNSNRNSLVSEGTPQRVLTHRNARIPDRRNRDSAESNISHGTVSPSPSAPLRKTPDALPALTVRRKREHLKPSPMETPNRRSASQPIPQVSSAQALAGSDSIVGLFDRRFSQATSPRGSVALSDDRRHSSQSMSNTRPAVVSHVRNFSAPLTSTASASYRRSPLRADTSQNDPPPVDDAIFPAILRTEPRSISDSKPPKVVMPRLVLPDINVDDSSVPLAESSFILSPQSEDQIQFTPTRARRPSNDGTVTEEIPRSNFDLGLPIYDPRRNSSERGNSRMAEHAMARITYAQSTPFSQASGVSEALEVSEATAVSIYPHNNHSLLVVQQAPRPATTSTASNQAVQDAVQPSNPNFTIEPATPTNNSENFDHVVDSPLRNPRKPPEPPAFKIIPPTPSQELDRELAGPPADNQLPQRRPSLLQRARRYSDNFIGSISRGGSLRRRAGSQPPRGRVPGVSDQETNLHPFWRPRGFWDDFSDSDSDSDFGFPSQDDRLPRGGDTSDVEPSPAARATQLGRRLTNGFRGTGGFLIGNSLGVERHGTNVRRHHVALPARLASLRRRRALADRDIAILRDEMPSPMPLSQDAERKLNSGAYLDLSGSNSSLTRTAAVGSGSGAGCNPPRPVGVRKLRRVGKGLHVPRAIPLPGTRRQLQYVGFRGMREKFRERRAEKRRERLRGRIGGRVFVVDGVVR